MMLKLTLTDNDVVLVLLPVDPTRRQYVLQRSVKAHCDECDRECWRDPRPPIAEATKDGALKPARAILPRMTVLLCIPCAQAHGLPMPWLRPESEEA